MYNYTFIISLIYKIINNNITKQFNIKIKFELLFDKIEGTLQSFWEQHDTVVKLNESILLHESKGKKMYARIVKPEKLYVPLFDKV